MIERDGRAGDPQPAVGADPAAGSAAGREADQAAELGADPATDPGSDPATQPLGLTEVGLEALLFVAERPLSRREIAILSGVDRETVDARVGDLEISLAARGIRLVTSGDRVELATAPEAGRLIGRYVGADATRLSPAALETLAIVVYRQPVTKGGVERIRGVDSDYTMRALLHRRLIVELGRAETPGRPYLYGTDFEVLERFGIASLEQLPPLDADVAARLVETVEDGSALEAPGDDDRGPGIAVGPGPA